MVFVALDKPDGKPTPVPSWTPRDDNERRLQEKALHLLELSKSMEQLVDTRGAGND
jgi:acyl-CoA hydrolase